MFKDITKLRKQKIEQTQKQYDELLNKTTLLLKSVTPDMFVHGSIGIGKQLIEHGTCIVNQYDLNISNDTGIWNEINDLLMEDNRTVDLLRPKLYLTAKSSLLEINPTQCKMLGKVLPTHHYIITDIKAYLNRFNIGMEVKDCGYVLTINI